MKIGIIGLGFVGGAVKNAHDLAKIETICIDPYKGYLSSYRDIKNCDIIYVCVPSPTKANGECDTTILENVLSSLDDYDKPVVSKVTAPPSTYIQLQKKYPNLVHAPEFLVAATANDDYINGTYVILGGNEPFMSAAENFIVLAQPKVTNIAKLTIGEASLAKYAINSFLSTKVVFMNELKKLADAAGLNYEKTIDAVQFDTRQGHSHFSVPGPDGKYGFGGACFPKDTSALLKYAESLGINLSVLSQAVQTNNIIRNG